jgi:hypothetical protein
MVELISNTKEFAEAFVEKCASRGLSIAQTAQLLEITRNNENLHNYIKSAGMFDSAAKAVARGVASATTTAAPAAKVAPNLMRRAAPHLTSLGVGAGTAYGLGKMFGGADDKPLPYLPPGDIGGPAYTPTITEPAAALKSPEPFKDLLGGYSAPTTPTSGGFSFGASANNAAAPVTSGGLLSPTPAGKLTNVTSGYQAQYAALERALAAAKYPMDRLPIQRQMAALRVQKTLAGHALNRLMQEKSVGRYTNAAASPIENMDSRANHGWLYNNVLHPFSSPSRFAEDFQETTAEADPHMRNIDKIRTYYGL